MLDNFRDEVMDHQIDNGSLQRRNYEEPRTPPNHDNKKK